VTIKLALKPDLPGILADRGQMQQIVMNLSSMPPKPLEADQSGTVTIATRAQEVSGTDRILDEVTAHPLAPEATFVSSGGHRLRHGRRDPQEDLRPVFTTKFIGRGWDCAALAGMRSDQHGGAIDSSRRAGSGRHVSRLPPRRGGSRSSEA